MQIADTTIRDTKYDVFGILYNAIDYTSATQLIIEAATQKKSFGVSALAVHGLIESYQKPSLREKVNNINLVVPDGQPVRWVLNKMYHTRLKDRVYGPELTWRVLDAANRLRLNIFLYGSTAETLRKLSLNIKRSFPLLNIVGQHVDRFRDATVIEDAGDIERINRSEAHIVLVGRGCPRQEIWVSDHLGKVNAVMMAVGAAFDFHAGTLKQAPKWMQNAGLEWFFRLMMEPGRLWKRYLTTNSLFIYLFIKSRLGLKI